MAQTNSKLPGIEIGKPDLIRARPPRGTTGFAPSGRVRTHQWGTNRSIFLGRGMEFAESRVYQPGDDVKNIDWRVTARTGQTHTKLFQEERERPVHILLDLRAMMHFGSRVRFKSNLATEIAAQLAWVGHDGGDRVGGLLLHKDGYKDFKAARTRRAVLEFMEAAAEATHLDQPVGQELALPKAIRRLRHSVRPGALVFLISDFWDFDDITEQELQRLSLRAHVTLVMVNDPLDEALPRSAGRITNGEDILSLSSLKSRSLDDYSLAYSDRLDRLHALTRRRGMAFHTISTGDDPRSLLNPDKRSASSRNHQGARS